MKLRDRVIRLAYQNSEIRQHLLPILKTSSYGGVGLYAKIPINGDPQNAEMGDRRQGRGRTGKDMLKQILYRLKQEKEARHGISISNESSISPNGLFLGLHIHVDRPGNLNDDDLIEYVENWLLGPRGATGILGDIAEEDNAWEYIIYGGLSSYNDGNPIDLRRVVWEVM